MLEAFWRDFKPKSDEVMERKPSRSHRGARRVPRPTTCSRPSDDGGDPRQCPKCVRRARGGRLSLRGGQVRRLHRLLELSRVQVHPQVRPAGRRWAEPTKTASMGTDPESGRAVTRKPGRFGPYIQLGEGKEAKRASIPKDLPDFDLDWALQAAEPAARRSARIPKPAT